MTSLGTIQVPTTTIGTYGNNHTTWRNPPSHGCILVVPQPVYMNMSDLAALASTNGPHRHEETNNSSTHNNNNNMMMMMVVGDEGSDLKTPTAEDLGGLGSDGSGSSGYGGSGSSGYGGSGSSGYGGSSQNMGESSDGEW